MVALVDSHFNRLEILVQYLSHQSSSEGLGEPVQMLRVTIAFTARMHNVGVAPITHARNKSSYIQGRSPNVVKVSFHTIRNCP